MRLLIDSDIFCKLGVSDLLQPAIEAIGAELSDCARLAALPYMLRRGSFRERIGATCCATLVPLAESFREVPAASPEWLDRLALVPNIDPGEAQLLAVAAEHKLVVMTGDKRALEAVKGISGFSTALESRVVVLEALVLALCQSQGDEDIRKKLRPMMTVDTMIRTCFSAGNPTPQSALQSYFDDAVRGLAPLVLWDPNTGVPP